MIVLYFTFTLEANERMKHQLSNLEEQLSVQSSLYSAGNHRAQRAEDESRSLSAKVRALEADLRASETAMEEAFNQKDKVSNRSRKWECNAFLISPNFNCSLEMRK